MSEIIEWIFFIALCGLCAVSLITLIKWLIAYSTEKEKALVGSRESVIAGIIAASIFTLLFVIELITGHPVWIYGIAAVCELIYLPAAAFSILTPKGICRILSLKNKYVPLSDVSYEFTDKFLAIYIAQKNGSKMVRYHYGIKNIKTVKMLADWYPKHNMTNPLLNESENDNDNKGE